MYGHFVYIGEEGEVSNEEGLTLDLVHSTSSTVSSSSYNDNSSTSKQKTATLMSCRRAEKLSSPFNSVSTIGSNEYFGRNNSVNNHHELPAFDCLSYHQREEEKEGGLLHSSAISLTTSSRNASSNCLSYMTSTMATTLVGSTLINNCRHVSTSSLLQGQFQQQLGGGGDGSGGMSRRRSYHALPKDFSRVRRVSKDSTQLLQMQNNEVSYLATY